MIELNPTIFYPFYKEVFALYGKEYNVVNDKIEKTCRNVLIKFIIAKNRIEAEDILRARYSSDAIEKYFRMRGPLTECEYKYIIRMEKEEFHRRILNSC